MPSSSSSTNQELIFLGSNFSSMLRLLNKRLRRLYSRIRWPARRRSEPVVKKFRKYSSKSRNDSKNEIANNGSATVHPNAQIMSDLKSKKSIRVATFNAALFSMAPAVPPKLGNPSNFEHEDEDFNKVNLSAKSVIDRPKSILKQSPLHSRSVNGTVNFSEQQKFAKSKLRVSINLPDNEISLLRNRKLSFREEEKDEPSSSNISRLVKGKGQLKSRVRCPTNCVTNGGSKRTVLEVLRELDVDILALQDVKAEEENAMKPLSDLAAALGMHYVFAESWAPEYGNAVLSKWPIKCWKLQKIFDDTDFRNVLKATIDVPQIGQVNFHCTRLDHLDESWRMKQMTAIIQSNDLNEPHILAGGLNSLDETDYSSERWTDIVKYYEEMRKPTPKVDVMKFMKSKRYTDSKDFAGECEPVVMIVKGQSVQGTCKYGTRVDYILASPDSPYKFVPGSYSVLSSKGTSDHHIVKVDITKEQSLEQKNVSNRNRYKYKQKVVKISGTSPAKGIWKAQTPQRE